MCWFGVCVRERANEERKGGKKHCSAFVRGAPPHASVTSRTLPLATRTIDLGGAPFLSIAGATPSSPAPPRAGLSLITGVSRAAGAGGGDDDVALPPEKTSSDGGAGAGAGAGDSSASSSSPATRGAFPASNASTSAVSATARTTRGAGRRIVVGARAPPKVETERRAAPWFRPQASKKGELKEKQGEHVTVELYIDGKKKTSSIIRATQFRGREGTQRPIDDDKLHFAPTFIPLAPRAP